MTRQEFLDQVLSPLGRLTAQERENVRWELEEHVEDRMEVMLDMGWDKELVESRCLEAMGDPAEIGREMARQYRGRGWLWLGRAAVVLTAVVCIRALLDGKRRAVLFPVSDLPALRLDGLPPSP